MYINLVLVALGGALGAVSRYLMSTWVTNKLGSIFPWGTFAVNILGSFCLGLIFILSLDKSMINPQLKMFISIGFLGAFTTFSTFSVETVNIIKGGDFSGAFLNIGASIIIGLGASFLGMTAGQLLK